MAVKQKQLVKNTCKFRLQCLFLSYNSYKLQIDL